MAKMIINIPASWISEMKKERYPSIHQYMKICHAIRDGTVLPAKATKGDLINSILDVDKDCTDVHGENGTMTFTVTQEWWDSPCEGGKNE